MLPPTTSAKPKSFLRSARLNALNWAYTSARLYNHDSLSDFEILQASYAYLTIDPEPGNRTRAHSKIVLSHITGEMIPVAGSDYSQSAEYNGDSGGKMRHFAAIRPEVLATTAVVHLVGTHTAIARATQPELFAERDVTIGLHQIRYNTRGLEPSFSSPVGPHSDDEPFVAVILIAVSSNLTGDGNYLWPGVRTSRTRYACSARSTPFCSAVKRCTESGSWPAPMGSQHSVMCCSSPSPSSRPHMPQFAAKPP